MSSGSIKEDKPPLVSQQCVVYSFQCSLCDAGYVGYTILIGASLLSATWVCDSSDTLDSMNWLRGPNNVGRAVQTDLTLLGPTLFTLRNNTQQHPTTCNRVCKRTQHVTSNSVGSCWSTMLRPFARSLKLVGNFHAWR